MYRTKEAMKDIWRQMNRRCHNQKAADYYRYGAKGITVCDAWRESFEAFYSDMEPSPKGLSLDRIDNAKGYSKENCRWVTPKEQGRNRYNTPKYTHDGKTMILAEWADEYGISRGTLHDRVVKRGMSLVDALTIPVRLGNRIANMPLTSELRPSDKPKRPHYGFKKKPAANAEQAEEAA